MMHSDDEATRFFDNAGKLSEPDLVALHIVLCSALRQAMRRGQLRTQIEILERLEAIGEAMRQRLIAVGIIDPEARA